MSDNTTVQSEEMESQALDHFEVNWNFKSLLYIYLSKQHKMCIPKPTETGINIEWLPESQIKIHTPCAQ